MLVEKIKSLKNFNLILFAKGTYKGTQLLFHNFVYSLNRKAKEIIIVGLVYFQV